MARLEDKKAVVTGATSGIGKATAIMFAKEGAEVVITGRNQEKGEAIVAEIEAAGGKAYFIACDMRKKEDAQKLHDFALEKLGTVNVLMNSAGVLCQKPFLDLTDDDYDFIMETNLRGYVWNMQNFIPDMVEAGGGSIINIASVSSVWPELNSYFYGCSKAAVSNLSMNVAKEFAPKGVRINVIMPGPVETGMTPKEILEDPAAYKALVEKFCPLGRFGQPVDIAYAATYFASDESSWVTAASIAVDGGVCISN